MPYCCGPTPSWCDGVILQPAEATKGIILECTIQSVPAPLLGTAVCVYSHASYSVQVIYPQYREYTETQHMYKIPVLSVRVFHVENTRAFFGNFTVPRELVNGTLP